MFKRVSLFIIYTHCLSKRDSHASVSRIACGKRGKEDWHFIHSSYMCFQSDISNGSVTLEKQTLFLAAETNSGFKRVLWVKRMRFKCKNISWMTMSKSKILSWDFSFGNASWLGYIVKIKRHTIQRIQLSFSFPWNVCVSGFTLLWVLPTRFHLQQ